MFAGEGSVFSVHTIWVFYIDPELVSAKSIEINKIHVTYRVTEMKNLIENSRDKSYSDFKNSTF